MYKIYNDKFGEQYTVKRLADNAFIPFDPANRDYADYLKWLEAGNTPEPAGDQSNEKGRADV